MKPRRLITFYLDTHGNLDPIRLLAVQLLFERRDAWIGVYWNVVPIEGVNEYIQSEYIHVYICLLPFLPLYILLRTHKRAPYPPGLYDEDKPQPVAVNGNGAH